MSELASRSYVRKLVRERELFLSRDRGQNFLVDPRYLQKMGEAANLSAGDRVLEIGAGFGVLTQLLASQAGWVVAVEIDQGVFEVLEEHLGSAENVRLILGDALKLDLVELLEELPQTASTCVGWQAPKVVANLPYSITTPLIARLLEEVHPVRPLESIVVMVQKEMAERISAAPGTKDYSSFGILVEYYAEAEVLDRVPANAFFPTPRVDSTILKLSLRSTPAVEVVDRQLFFDVVRAGFGHRRKTLANALAAAGNALSLTKEEARSALRSASIDPRKRAERLTMKQFGRLADNVYQVQEQEA